MNTKELGIYSYETCLLLLLSIRSIAFAAQSNRETSSTMTQHNVTERWSARHYDASRGNSSHYYKPDFIEAEKTGGCCQCWKRGHSGKTVLLFHFLTGSVWTLQVKTQSLLLFWYTCGWFDFFQKIHRNLLNCTSLGDGDTAEMFCQHFYSSSNCDNSGGPVSIKLLVITSGVYYR